MGQQVTRRAFCGSVVAAALGSRVRTAQRQPVELALDPFPLAAEVERVRDRLAAAPEVRATGLSSERYLEIAEGIVRFFARHQDRGGAILDPYTRGERQYSTPAFALTAAVLLARGRARDLEPAGLAAMDRACADLPAGRAADQHPDFYISLLMQALPVLEPLVPPARAERWRADLRRIDPSRIYRFQPGGPRPANNWNLVAAFGEAARHRAGLSPDLSWVERSLAEQMAHFTPHGLYRDPDDPLPYDHFARFHLNLLLEQGYRGAQAERLRELLARGAWTSLFMVSPHGEAPCGGRSAHHQWNEAQQAVTFELYARRFAAFGDRGAAGAFKRAARLSLLSIARWVRPSGELWIVKNRMDPAARHGYERYSFHSQYNLLCAAKLAAAALAADDRIEERPVPAELGGVVFQLAPAFHKVFASAGGCLVEIDTGADLRHNPTGILRVHVAGVPPQLGLSDGLVAAPAYHAPTTAPHAVALGPAWQDGAGDWHRLADHGRDDLASAEMAVVARAPSRVEFNLRYAGRLRGGATAVRQQIIATPAGIEVVDSIDGDVRAVRSECPLLVDDGARRPEIAAFGSAITSSLQGAAWQVSGLDGATVRRVPFEASGRNGTYGLAVIENTGRRVAYRAGRPA